MVKPVRGYNKYETRAKVQLSVGKILRDQSDFPAYNPELKKSDATDFMVKCDGCMHGINTEY